jgi:hypothetical protein
MTVIYPGAGGLVECSTSTIAKPCDVIARIVGQNGMRRGVRMDRPSLVRCRSGLTAGRIVDEHEEKMRWHFIR